VRAGSGSIFWNADCEYAHQLTVQCTFKRIAFQPAPSESKAGKKKRSGGVDIKVCGGLSSRSVVSRVRGRDGRFFCQLRRCAALQFYRLFTHSPQNSADTCDQFHRTVWSVIIGPQLKPMTLSRALLIWQSNKMIGVSRSCSRAAQISQPSSSGS